METDLGTKQFAYWKRDDWNYDGQPFDFETPIYINLELAATYLQKYTIHFDAVYGMDKWFSNKDKNKLLEGNFNKTNSFININFGVIIGTSEYKKYIDEKMFNMLIKRQFCKIDIITYKTDNSYENKFNGEYYVYSCYDKFFTGQMFERHPSTNFYNYFPSLIFNSKQNIVCA